MSDANKLKITLTVQGRPFSLLIDRKDEEIYRIANKVVNKEVTKYLDSMPIKTAKREDTLENEIIAVTSACLNFATKFIKVANEYSDSPIEKRLKNIVNDLQLYIEKVSIEE